MPSSEILEISLVTSESAGSSNGGLTAKATSQELFSGRMAAQETAPAIYTPLDSSRNEIRLLEILPRSSDYECDHTVHCRLIHSSLDSRPSYTAISYVWGDPTEKKAVVVNGQLVQITTNLADALQQFREDGVETLWADDVSTSKTKQRGLGRFRK